jgi:homogentisate 1,2-dioxygenase
MRIHVNLDQVTGVGDLTGFRYNATGAEQVNLPAQPPDPTSNLALASISERSGTLPIPYNPPTQ